ncbi:SDR family NAD(P)-dependent oxidoreductase [Nocardia sp. NPDC059246]|uniref:SDR family NAD(P)-dependent oxidoreductase n=1 Tax=unclassified Nocardia TaxID=2637762 RepID=UPI0036AA5C22
MSNSWPVRTSAGGSRGIGLTIGRRAAADGANITLIAKTAVPQPKLSGTIHTAAAELERAGGRVLSFVADIRFDDRVEAAVRQTVDRFGGIVSWSTTPRRSTCPPPMRSP